MDHPAGPCRVTGVERGGEGRRGRRCWPGGHDESEENGRRKCERGRGAQDEGQKRGK